MSHPSTKPLRFLLLLLPMLGACATSNYAFEDIATLKGESRAMRLTSDLDEGILSGDEDALYDLKVIPFAHSRLAVFQETEQDGQGNPDGFVEADIEAYLPLFGILDVEVTRYTEDNRMSEHHEYNSYLWGIFQTHRELVDTRLGMRESRKKRFLWFFGWTSTPEYTRSPAQDAFVVNR